MKSYYKLIRRSCVKTTKKVMLTSTLQNYTWSLTQETNTLSMSILYSLTKYKVSCQSNQKLDSCDFNKLNLTRHCQMWTMIAWQCLPKWSLFKRNLFEMWFETGALHGEMKVDWYQVFPSSVHTRLLNVFWSWHDLDISLPVSSLWFISESLYMSWLLLSIF